MELVKGDLLLSTGHVFLRRGNVRSPHVHVHRFDFAALCLVSACTLDIGVGVEYLLQEKIQGLAIMKVFFRAERGRKQERNLRGSVQQELSLW